MREIAGRIMKPLAEARLLDLRQQRGEPRETINVSSLSVRAVTDS